MRSVLRGWMIHILPVNDLKEHVTKTTCSCNPDVRYRDEHGVLPEAICVHNSWDGREIIEQAEALINE